MKKTFYLLAPYLVDSLISKDVGIIPYIMQKHFDYKAVYATYRPTYGTVPFPTIDIFSEPVEVDYIEPSFEYHPEIFDSTIWGKNFYDCGRDMSNYIEKNALNIDVLYIFGFYHYYFEPIFTYKKLNPNGKVYLKLDINKYWFNKIVINETSKKFLEHCDLITSELLVDYISQKWEVPIHYIPNGYYDLSTKSNSLDETFSFADKEDIIFTAARLGNPAKASDVLLEAFALAAPSLPQSWKLVLAGTIDPDFAQYIISYNLRLPELSERIQYLGFIEDKDILQNWFKRAKIFTLPSYTESFANVLAEAKTYGCYLIVSNLDGSIDAISHIERRGKEHIEEEGGSKYFEYGSYHKAGYTEELAQRMIEASNNPVLLEEVCYTTQKDARDNLNWLNLCTTINELLNT